MGMLWELSWHKDEGLFATILKYFMGQFLTTLPMIRRLIPW